MKRYLLLILIGWFSATLGQVLKPESPLKFAYPQTLADLEQEIAAKKYRLTPEEWSVLESNLKQQQTQLATKLMDFDMQLSEVTHQLQALENVADITKIEALLLQRKNTRANILEMQEKLLRQIPLKGLYLVFMPVEDSYAYLDSLQKKAELTILPDAIKTLNGTFIHSITTLENQQVLADKLKEQVSGSMEMGNKLCGECESKRFDSKMNYYYKICEVNVYPLQKNPLIIGEGTVNATGEVQVVDLLHQEDYEKTLQGISSKTVKSKLLDLIKTYLPKHKNSIQEYNVAALNLQRKMIVHLAEELQSLDEKIAASEQRKAKTLAKLDSLAKNLGVALDVNRPQTCINDARTVLKSRFQEILTQKIALKNTELVYETVKVGGEKPSSDIAKGVFEHLPIWEERYEKLTDFQQEIEIQEGLVENFSLQTGEDLYRQLEQFWVYPVPANSAIYICVVLQFNTQQKATENVPDALVALNELDTTEVRKSVPIEENLTLWEKDSLTKDSLLKSYLAHSEEFAAFLAMKQQSNSVKMTENSPNSTYEVHIETSKAAMSEFTSPENAQKQTALKSADEAFNKGLYTEAISIYLLYLNDLTTNQLIRLARIYLEGGDGIQKNVKLAMQYFTLAVDKGSDAANFYLGYLYYQGKDIEGDDKQAFAYFDRAAKGANGGIAQANTYLGIMYEEGRLGSKDMGKAMECYTKAANQEEALAQYRLGKIYEEAKNKEQALHWYRKSARNGYEKAKKQLQGLN